MKKINKKQAEVLKSIKFLIESWERTNDIRSGTLLGDIDEELNKHIDDDNKDIIEGIKEKTMVILLYLKQIK